MSNTPLEDSLSPGGNHHLLARFVGSWQGTAKTWFEPDKLADESPFRGTCEKVFDGRFIRFEYESSLQDKPLLGRMLIGYYIPFDRFQMSWVDTFHMGTGILTSEGEGRLSEDGFSVLGHYSEPSGGEPWGWRTELAILAEDRISITHFNITPQGEESPAVEIQLTRESPA